MPAVIPIACCDTVNRGVAYADGKIFLNQLDTNTVALDAETGKELWKVKQGDYKHGPDGHLGADGDQGQGDLRASPAASSACAASSPRTTSTPASRSGGCTAPDPKPKSASPARWKPGRATSGSAAAARPGAGTATTPSSNLFYYGTGNPGSWNPDQRPGDNKYSMTIFARNPDTGKAKWAYQKTPHDAWDYDGINENVLVDLNINGQMRKVLVNFDRNGFAYVLDRTTGELLMAEPFVHVNWAKGVDLKTGKPIEDPEKRTSATKNTKDICPSAMGGKNQQPVSYLAAHRALLRAHQQPLHGLRGRRGEVPGRPALRRRDRREQAGSGRQPRRVHRLGSDDRQEGVGHQGGAVGLGRRARDRPATWSSTARWKDG